MINGRKKGNKTKEVLLNATISLIAEKVFSINREKTPFDLFELLLNDFYTTYIKTPFHSSL